MIDAELPAGGGALLRRGATGEPATCGSDFAARARTSSRTSVALVLGRPPRHLRRAAPRGRRRCRPASPPASVQPGDVVDAARPPLDRGRGRDARLPAPRRRARAAAADVQRQPSSSALARADRRAGDRRASAARRRSRSASRRADAVDAADRAAAGDAGRADRRGRGRTSAASAAPTTSRWSCTPPARRRRRRASRTRATRCATRPRASAGAGASTGDDVYLVGDRVRLRRRAGLRVPARAAQRRHRRADEPLGARGGAAADRGAPLHLRAADADARRRHAAWPRRPRTRPLLDARARRRRA